METTVRESSRDELDARKRELGRKPPPISTTSLILVKAVVRRLRNPVFLTFILSSFAGLWMAPVAYAAVVYSYTYIGPVFTGIPANITINFVTSAPLAPSTEYTSLPPGTLDSQITVQSTIPVGNFSLPVEGFFVNTRSTGAVSSWDIFGEDSTLSGSPPTETGSDFQALSLNTMSNLVPPPVGAVPGVAQDGAAIIDFYASCSGIPNCVLAGDGQPYVGIFGGGNIASSGRWFLNGTPLLATPEPGGISQLLLLVFIGIVACVVRERRATSLAR